MAYFRSLDLGNISIPGCQADGAAAAPEGGDRPVIVWLWEVDGPARTARGITDNEAAARCAAEACLLGGQARSAAVEMARAVLGTESLTSGYVRTGHGWMAKCRRDGQVSWTPLPRSADLAVL